MIGAKRLMTEFSRKNRSEGYCEALAAPHWNDLVCIQKRESGRVTSRECEQCCRSQEKPAF